MIDTKEIIEKHLGHSGAMVSYSKSGYMAKHKDSVIIFNSRIKLAPNNDYSVYDWWGDLDLTKSIDSIRSMCKELDSTVYIYFEMNGMLCSVSKDGTIKPEQEYMTDELSKL